MNIVDTIVEAFSPRAAVKRQAARQALDMMRNYDGASKGTRRTNGWRTKPTSANAEISRAHSLLRDRARDLARNNPYAIRGIDVLASNMVGYGIRTSIKTANKKTAKPLQAAWTNWAESTKCDAMGLRDMYGLQDICVRGVVESGEIIIRRRWKKNRKNKQDIPLELQVLEGDYIDSRKDVAPGKDGNYVIQGIEYDSDGRRVAYWLYDQHPGDAYFIGTNFTSTRVPAEDIIHVFRIDRAGQARGVSWFAPVIIRMRDLADYEDAHLLRQKIAACFSVFIKDMEPPDDANAKRVAAEMVERVEPGIIQRLPSGTDAVMASPPGVDGYKDYMSVSLHAVAAGLGIPYEALTGDYTGVNFTSGRMGFSQFNGLIDGWQWKMLIPTMCARIFEWFCEGALLAGYSVDGATAKYAPPARFMVDATKEVPNMIKAVRGGADTLYGMIRALGREPDEFLEEYAEGNKALDDRGIVLDSDPRKVTNGGQIQASDPPAEDTGDGSTTGDNGNNQ